MVEKIKIPLRGKLAEQHIVETLGYPIKTLLQFPKFFIIETINICNANCIMCGIDFKKMKKTVMSDELFEKIIQEIGGYRNHVEKVSLYWCGEPLLDNQLSVRIRKIKDKGIKVTNIATNASLLNEEKAEKIIKSGLDEIYITIDSLDKKIYESIRRGLCFEKVLENTLNFIKLRNEINPDLMIRVQMIQQELNYNEPDIFSKFWYEHLNDNDQVVVQKVHNWASKIEVCKFGDEDYVNNVPCIGLWGTLAIHATGEVPICCLDSETKVCLGDLNKQSIETIWQGKTLKYFREKHLNGQRSEIPMCNGCTLWRESQRDIKKVNKSQNI